MSRSTRTTNRQLTDEQMTQLEELVATYLEETPDFDSGNSSSIVALRSKLAPELGVNPVSLVKPLNEILHRLATPAAEPKQDSSEGKAKAPAKAAPQNPKVTRRHVDTDPKSASESEHAAAPKRAGRQPRGAVPAKDDVTAPAKGRRQPASANKANATGEEDLNSKVCNPLLNTLDGNCCNVDRLPYNYLAEIEIDDFDADADFFEAFEEFCQILIPNIADEFVEQCHSYLKSLRALHEKYPTADKTIDNKLKKAKPQQFKYTHGRNKGACVKYTNPADLKVAELPAKDAAPIIKFNEYLENTVAKALPVFGKPKTKKETEQPIQIDWLGILNSKIVYTSAIFGAAWYKKLIPNADAKFIRPLGIFLHEGVPSETDLLAAIKPALDINYVELFQAISKIPSAKLPAVAKNIYLARHRMLSLVRDSDASNNWMQAMNNIYGLTDEAVQNAYTSPQYKDLVTDEDLDIIHAWQNILRSRFVYYIVAKGIPANQIFEKAFIQLFTHPTSIKLFMTVLYPIACYFTPFHCHYDSDSFTMEKLPTNCSAVTYSKYIKNIIGMLMTSKGYDIKLEHWVYYSDNKCNEKTNVMIALLGPYVLAKPGKKTAGGAKASSNPMSAGTEDENNSGDEGDDEDASEQED